MDEGSSKKDGLNDRQREAAGHLDGALLIVAGAGAGKTKTLVHRIARLIENGVAPENILAITFTNKAAGEMQERVAEMLERRDAPYSSRPFVATFHALGAFILRNDGERIGSPRNFTILDKGDSLSLIKKAVKSENLDPKQFAPSRIQGAISREKGELIDCRTYAEQARGEYFPAIVSRVWAEYEALLAKTKSLDFDDLLLRAVLLLKEHGDVRERYRNRFKYIHIDEYQDTNTAQYELARLLADGHGNICVVGDADQNIYSWRGANIRNILNFEKDYKNAKTVLLEENYRSTRTILSAANEIIKKNTLRKEKNLFTRGAEGEKISLFGAYDETEEAEYVAEKIKNIKKGARGNIAVLFRANFQSRALEEAMLSNNVPYELIGTRFFERREIKDALSFIRAAQNRENILDFGRIINVPPRGIGKTTLEKVLAGGFGSLPARTREKITEFEKILSDIGTMLEKEPPSAITRFALRRSGILGMYRKENEEERERLENLEELVTVAAKYDSYPREEALAAFLSDAALASDQDDLRKGGEAVKLMTVHASKGLEFGHVFITGLEQGLFPHDSFGFGGDGSVDRAEEERRLFYVALTRAARRVYLTFASTRTIFGSKRANAPSEFLSDISEELMDYET
ncbi:UvrD-helicase domain-containing protein [bacterium]|nr:UvrD-helicase domain-containing protein [bacterium]